jgi:beta-mannosidase
LIDLHEGWRLAEAPADAGWATLLALPDAAWLPATAPGSAHGALLAAGRMPDPFQGRQEAEVQWVGERTWVWRLAFRVEDFAEHEDLVFEGLDTFCTVWLNGEKLLASNNMFVPARVDVRQRLRIGTNELCLRFDPALARARELEAVHGKRPLWNGDSARLHARKAQYHFGWDWGPDLQVSGPWRAVRRHSWTSRIEELQCRTSIDVERGRASVQVSAAGVGAADASWRFELLDPQGRTVAQAVSADKQASVVLLIPQAQLWWPRGLGEQPLYTLITQRLAGGEVLAQDQRRIGLRTLRLLHEEVAGEAGSSFHFEVNGQEFFAGGANWIPDDNLLERITPERYRERVAQAADANMNMLRVWGGGIYEHEAFYEACDELGLLVWQDFMFACGLYPAHAEFMSSVRAEATTAIKRLRHHACMALWCGNNEDYMLAESVGLSGPGIAPEAFEARAIYEHLLPEICAALDPDRAYWPGSPYTPSGEGSKLSTDKIAGDRHSWEVWHQQMLPYQRYGEVQGRFVSEFGMQSHPSLKLLESVLPQAERYPESRTVMWHNKAGSGVPDGHRRLAVYMADNLRVGPSLAEHVYATQFVQAEAMRVAFQDFRRRWQQPGARAVGGALVWQLNDCWPATSWALIDSGGAAKPAWHTTRRALAPLAVALRLEPGLARLALMNGERAGREFALNLRVFGIDGRLLFDTRLRQNVPTSSCVEITQALDAFEEPVVAELLALDARDGRELARDCAWTEPFKFYFLHGAELQIRVDGPALHVSCDRPVKGLCLQADGVSFADNFIDLVPGAPRRIEVRGRMLTTLEVVALDHPGHIVGLRH